jgi:hypothetical protein
MNRRMPNGTYGGVRGWGREAPAYSIVFAFQVCIRLKIYDMSNIDLYNLFGRRWPDICRQVGTEFPCNTMTS